MISQRAYDSGLRGIPSLDSAQHHRFHRYPQDLPYLAPENTQRRDLSTPGAAGRPLGPPQYAFPVRTNPPALYRHATYSGVPNGGSPATDAEHMLRRKTPNGTLAAGYDGTPVHWSTNPPPFKHVVMPMTDQLARERGNAQALRASIQRANSDNVSWRPTTTEWKVESPLAQSSWVDTGDQSVPPNSGFMPGYEPRNLHDRAEVPTVLQPPYQPCVGPTASNGPGAYGPSYVQGRAEAYRPAAVRDTALHPFHPLPGPLFSNSPDHDHHMGAPSNWSLNSLSSMIPDAQTGGREFACHEVHTLKQESHDTPLAFRPLHRGDYSLHSSPTQAAHPSRQNLNSYRNHNVQFRERVLGWAHGIYVDLLASIYKTKRDAYQARKKQGMHRSYSSTSIYPRPPRQTAFLMRRPSDPAYCSDGIFKHATGIKHSTVTPHDLHIRPRRSNSLLSMMEDKRSYAARVPPSVRGMEGSYVAPRHNYGSHGESPLSLYLNEAPRSETLHDIARSALEMLETFCHESGGRWVDGMLLAGCLAYGLEEFERSLEWYSMIIAIDPTHVEAISNLAATLLSLNRRQEAEQHWLQAVKLRPCYFEAVEHLVGLLCGDQRATEAISIIDFVERSLRVNSLDSHDWTTDASSDGRRSSTTSSYASSENPTFDYDLNSNGDSYPPSGEDDSSKQPGFGSSGYAIPGADNGRMLALVHAKGNMLYAQHDIDGASRAFEDAVLISVGRRTHGIRSLIQDVIAVVSSSDGKLPTHTPTPSEVAAMSIPVLLPPEKALQTARLVFARHQQLPGSQYIVPTLKHAAIATTSNSLLSLAKIYQDGMTSASHPLGSPHPRQSFGTADILALYYLSLSLQPSPSTANNVGILLAGIPPQAPDVAVHHNSQHSAPSIPGVKPGSGIELALAYYDYGLKLDNRHAHLYTNLGSLLKDIGQLTAAIKMYEKAVECDGQFDIALANLANAVKDQGRIKDAISYYKRACAASPDFAEAVCGLANALNSVCDWKGRGGVIMKRGKFDRWHVSDDGMLLDARDGGTGRGWIQRVVTIVQKQLADGASWGRGALQGPAAQVLLRELEIADCGSQWPRETAEKMHWRLQSWIGKAHEGARIVQLVERAVKRAMHRWYRDKYVHGHILPRSSYARPRLPRTLTIPGAPTVLPFHTFTCPLSAKEIRTISQRNALRISCSTLRAPWLPETVYPPPPPPAPHLNIGYVSSDFNNHPLAHLMQSVFGMHDRRRAKAFCYATTASDKSAHRKQIEEEAPVFRDTSSWSPDRLVQQIVKDEIHILINLNGYTRGAKNEVFAARPVPIQMSFMGFAGTLGAEWCDYLFADETAIPQSTLRPWRKNIDLEDQHRGDESAEAEDWVYGENVIFSQDSFFCCDHRQSSSDAQLPWPEEQQRKWKMRKELFPDLPDSAVILGNFNQLYKIEPTTFRTWLRILAKVPDAVLWLLRFPDLGESNLRQTALLWAGEEVASRIIFTDVAPKNQHISRARICDLFLDTPECNAHTTAADILWSSTPLLTLPRYEYKMCSRMAASILKGALPKNEEGRRAVSELVAADDDQYEEFAVKLASGLTYDSHGRGRGRLNELRRLLYEHRRTSALFDTKRWVRDLERAYEEAWHRWVEGTGGDIYL